MTDKPFIKPERLIIDDWPENLIPASGKAFSFTDGNCTVKGFYDPNSGVTHIQEITTAPEPSPNLAEPPAY